MEKRLIPIPEWNKYHLWLSEKDLTYCSLLATTILMEVGFLELDNGKCPYLEWEQKLDSTIRGAVRVKINRLRLGNFGDCKTIKGARGLYELRIHMGAGYRLYFGKAHDKLVVMLCNGSKRSQERDIEKAKEYWQFYKELQKRR